jgi:hypothetical protein
MTDLAPSVWREIEKSSLYLPQQSSVGRFIGLGTLRTILKRSKRTNDQNALVHALFDDTIRLGGESLGGWTREDIKEWALGEYWGWDKYEAFGRVRLKPKKRSSRMTKLEMSDFIEWYVRTMAGHGIVLQLPGESDGSGSKASGF